MTIDRCKPSRKLLQARLSVPRAPVSFILPSIFHPLLSYNARRNPICKYFSHLNAEINDGRGKLVASPYIGFIVTRTVYPGDLIFDFSHRMSRRRFRGIPAASTLKRFFRHETYVARAKCKQTVTNNVYMCVKWSGFICFKRTILWMQFIRIYSNLFEFLWNISMRRKLTVNFFINNFRI